MNRIGYIGLGIMGRPAALNLLRAGYPVRVWARRAETTQPLTDAGATACSSAAELARQTDIIFTNVSNTDDVRQVVLGEGGIIQGARAGTIVVDMSTISPSATRELAGQLAAKGVDMLDAPVSGGEQGAIDGTLSFMVGGKQAVFDRLLPVFEAMGRNIVRIGDHGAGQVAKACNQVIVGQTIVAIGEAFLLARKAGVDPAKVRQALLGGFAGSRVLESHGQRMIDRNFRAGFKSRLHQKDLQIVMEEVTTLGLTLPGSELLGHYLDELVADGLSEDDSISIFRLQERTASLDGD